MEQRKQSFHADEVVLSFFDTLIHGRDLELLQSDRVDLWINDVLIGFYNEVSRSSFLSHLFQFFCFVFMDN